MSFCYSFLLDRPENPPKSASQKKSSFIQKALYFCGIKMKAETLTLVLNPKKGKILQKRFRNALMNENVDGSELTYSKHT